jgi:signal transduction histidine kinase
MTHPKTRAAAGGVAPRRGRKRAAPADRSSTERLLGARSDALRAEIAALERDRAELCSVLSHDLRNPLTVVVWSAQMLARRLPPEDASRRALDAVARAADEMNQMLLDLSDAARIHDGRLPAALALEACEPAALVEQAAASTRVMAQSKALTITLDVPPELPPLLCDRERIARVLGGILGNAARRTPRGGAVSVHAARVGDGGRDALRIVVEDGGPEIAREDRATLFSLPAAPSPGAPRRPRTMTPAIALFVARGVVEAHGGELDLESEPGQGARFVLTLPASPRP